MENGYFERWGKDESDDPTYSPWGPEIADIEISTKCNGISGKLCQYCYKSNVPTGANMSLDTFKSVISKMNANNTLTQVAFGLGSNGDENPALWDMCDYLRENNIIPNGTVAQLSDETAQKIADHFGGVAISYHNDWDVLIDTINKLTTLIKNGKAKTLRQVNIHFMICEETYSECTKLLRMIKNREITGVRAVVLLSLKKCGRAANDNFHQLSIDKFRDLVGYSLIYNIGIGFDSCSAHKFSSVIKELFADKPDTIAHFEQLCEPCESFGVFSSYVNVDGNYYSCSFAETIEKPISVLECGDFIGEVWNSDLIANRRSESFKRNRQCPYYEI
jgi:hypothetical protein